MKYFADKWEDAMTEKEMKRLSRAELLELLLVQTKETERLQKKLEKVETLLLERNLQVQKAGDLAHAVLEINGVMESAQSAAQQYLDNIIRMEQETKLRCEKMLAQAQAEAEQLRQEAQMPHQKEETIQPMQEDFIGEIYALLDEK